MKTTIKLLLVGLCLCIYSCNVEPIDTPENEISQENTESEDKSQEVSDIDEALESVDHRYRYKKKTASYTTRDADRCGPEVPEAVFWWPGGNGGDFVESFFKNTKHCPLKLVEYSDGTARAYGIVDAVLGQSCKVWVDLHLKKKKNWHEWSSAGGDFKEEGCTEAVAEDQNYYIIDSRRSYIKAFGGDCNGQGYYGLEQRPDPDGGGDNFGVALGKGGALWDSDKNATGLAGWAWITNLWTGERLWNADFNFVVQKKKRKIHKCVVLDADRCGDDVPNANFWWPGGLGGDFKESFFANSNRRHYTYTEYDDGTANVRGTTNAVFGRDCEVVVDLWLKEKKSWSEWQAIGGTFKDEGCTGAVAENQSYFVVDQERSSIKSMGSECLGEGTYGLEQRPDPNGGGDNFGIVVGRGGALWDTRQNANGLAGWVYITNKETGERLWHGDFNFRLACWY